MKNKNREEKASRCTFYETLGVGDGPMLYGPYSFRIASSANQPHEPHHLHDPHMGSPWILITMEQQQPTIPSPRLAVVDMEALIVLVGQETHEREDYHTNPIQTTGPYHFVINMNVTPTVQCAVPASPA